MKTPTHLLVPEMFQAWMSRKETQEFFRFLMHRQTDLMEAWGRVEPWAQRPEIQAQAVLLGQLSDLTAQDLRDYYLEEELTDGQDD